MRLFESLRAGRTRIAAAFTEEWYRVHPESDARWGPRGRELTLEDTGYHIDFLAGAAHLGSTQAFGDYIRWARRVLEPRGLGVAVLAETLTILEQLTGGVAEEEDQRQFLHEMFSAGRDALRENAAAGEPRSDAGALSAVQEVYLQSLLVGQRRAALNIVMEAIREGTPLLDIYLRVFQDSLYEVGRLWESRRISVASEHMATAITQYVMAQVYARMEPSAERRGNAIVTGVQGELHQVGAAMLADILDQRGWNVRFLGTNMPHDGILEAIEAHRPKLLCISATMLFNTPAVGRLVESVHKKFGQARPRIALGGAAFRSRPDIWKELGADGFAPDLETAIATVDAITA